MGIGSEQNKGEQGRLEKNKSAIRRGTLAIFISQGLCILVVLFFSRTFYMPASFLFVMLGGLTLSSIVVSLAMRRVDSSISEKMRSAEGTYEATIAHLGKRQEEIESILENMREGVIVIDSDERILVINKQALNLFLVQQEAVGTTEARSYEGRSLIDVFRNANFNAAIEQMLETHSPLHAPIQVWDGDRGSHRTLDMTGVFIDSADGSLVRILIVLRDVSKLIRLEQVRKDFVSNVSHELKTPITAIQGFAETLLDGALEDRGSARHFVEIILNQSIRIREIVADLLILSSIEQQEQKQEHEVSEGRTLKLRDVDIIELIHKSLNIVQSKPEHADIPVHISAYGDMNLRLNPVLFEQLFINLFDNAMRYGGREVELWVSAKQLPEKLELCVRDNGPGIPQRYIPRLFERFYRVDTEASAGGTGLGLAIVKHIVQAHGGTITVTSTVAEGTCFSITIPSGTDPSGSDPSGSDPSGSDPSGSDPSGSH